MSNDNSEIRPFQFINFEELDEEKGIDPLLQFNIKRPKKFIPEFETKEKYEFRDLFSQKGELTKEDYERSVKEYYENKKREIDKKIEQLFNEKKQEAEKIVEQAKIQAQTIEKQAFEKGYKEGKEQGFKQGEEELNKILNEFFSLVKKLKDFEQELIAKHENEIVSLIIDLVKLIVKTELKINAENILVSNLKNTLKKVVDKGKIEIKINPEQYQYLLSKIKEITDSEDIEEYKIVKSSDIEPGGCIVDTNFGTYDARIKEQINELEKILKGNNR